MGYLSTAGTLEKIASSAEAAQKILNDPALPRVTRMILELNRIEEGAKKPGSKQSAGVGLKHIEKPLSYYVYVRKNPWALLVGAAVLIGIPYAIGNYMGKKRR